MNKKNAKIMKILRAPQRHNNAPVQRTNPENVNKSNKVFFRKRF